MKKFKNISIILMCGVILFALSVFAWIKAPNGYSVSERRTLAQLPQVQASSLKNGKFMDSFDSYATDQFPMRDGFRTLKAVIMKDVLGMKDNHGLYSVDGYLSKLEFPLNDAKVGGNIKKLNEIQKQYLDGTKCKTYLSLIPDKNYFLASQNGYPTIDYQKLTKTICESVKADTYIDIFDLLSLEDYYYTDQHWKQESILDVAEQIGNAMNDEKKEYKKEDYQVNVLDHSFYGAYVGQSSLPSSTFGTDTITYYTDDEINACVITSYNNGEPQEAYMYDMSKAYGRDPYEMFLSGSDPLIVIENPSNQNGRELVVFRDSFGSSIIPLLTKQYEKITVVDLRYMRSSLLGDYVEFHDQDVLYLYSTLIFNNNISM